MAIDLSKYTGKQKTAIFLLTIGSDVSAQVMRNLSDVEIDQVSYEIAKITKVLPEEKELVLQEFQELMMAQDFITQGGVDQARELLEKALGTQKAIDVVNRLTSTLHIRPFDFVRRQDLTQVLNFIQGEHPQTIALILSYLGPIKSAYILSNLPRHTQANIARRISYMDRTSPEVLREVERVLERQLSMFSDEDFSSAGGLDTTVAILSNVDRTTERNILERLEDTDQELAEEIKKRMFVFEDIVLLDDRAIQSTLREIDPSDLAKALKSVDIEVQNKIFGNISQRAALLLKEDMEFMGPVRLKDVEEAQQKIVNVIRRLEENGDIVIARTKDDELIG